MIRNREILSRFIVLEGIDGAGTTTQRQMLEDRFRSRGLPLWSTAEPTDSPLGRLCRQILKGDIQVAPEAVAAAFSADRWNHVEGHAGIRQNLAQGNWVVCDRYIFSSLAYQGLVCDMSLVDELNGRFPLPEKLIFIDVPEHVASERRASREDLEIYETSEFQRRVSDSYKRVLDRFEEQGMRILRVPGQINKNEIHDLLLDFLELSDN